MPWKRLSDTHVAKFERLAWPQMPAMLRVARYLTRREAEAEDLVQEAMMKAMRSIDRFDGSGDIRPWLLTILRRTWIDSYRSNQSRRSQLSLDEATLPEPQAMSGEFDEQWNNPEDLLDRFDNEEIVQALGELPDEIRWTLLLVDVEQIEHDKAAGVLGVPVGTIKSRAFRGRGMLRDRLLPIAMKRGWVKADEKEAGHER